MIPFTAALRRRAQSDPSYPAVTVEDTTLTRGELESRTNRLARAFESLGVVENSFVTIALPNCHAYVESAIAALKLGATPQPVSGRLPEAELKAIIDLARPSLIVGVDGSDFPAYKTVPRNFEPEESIDDSSLPDRVARAWKAPTSGGSTGLPKLIVSGTPAQIDESPEPFAPPFLLPVDGTVLVPGPVSHNAGFTLGLQALLRGNHVVLMSRFDPLQTLTLIDRQRPEYVLFVPTMMNRIWKLPEIDRSRFDMSSLKVVYHMASHCPEWLKLAWIEWLGAERIFELYGGTEMQALTVLDGKEWLAHRGSVGRCVVGEMKILSEDGTELGPHAVGEIYMRPPPGSPPTYYYIGAEAERIGDWETLGDIGWFDEDAYLYLADRRTDMIVRGGANIYPAEVEAAIDEHPAVESSAVIGLPDEDLGQRVHALVQVKTQITDKELLGHLGARLARYKVPASIEFVNEPLRDDAGKVRRPALREARV